MIQTSLYHIITSMKYGFYTMSKTKSRNLMLSYNLFILLECLSQMLLLIDDIIFPNSNIFMQQIKTWFFAVYWCYYVDFLSLAVKNNVKQAGGYFSIEEEMKLKRSYIFRLKRPNRNVTHVCKFLPRNSLLCTTLPLKYHNLRISLAFFLVWQTNSDCQNHPTVKDLLLQRKTYIINLRNYEESTVI